MQNVCIAVHDSMLAAALAVPSILQPLSPQQTLQARQERYQAGRSAPYPAWYLFGCKDKFVEGLVALYHHQGANVFLCPQSRLSPSLQMDIVDTQFCSVRVDLYESLVEHNIKVIGYLPEEFSSKASLAQFMLQNGGEAFMPTQQSFTRFCPPELPEGTENPWIVKTPYGSAGRNSTGDPYTVWQDDHLRQQLPQLLNQLQSDQQLICSEFIVTSDPYANFAQHVVHKLHYLGEKRAKEVQPYGSVCQRFIHHCNWPLLAEKKSLPLPEFIGEPEITVGSIENVNDFAHFSQLLDFHQGRVMLSVDFMIPADGKPRFLESNKLAATFAERFDPHLVALIDAYGRLPLEHVL